MFAVHQDNADQSVGRVANYLGNVFSVFADARLNSGWPFRWLQEQARRNATIRGLNLLSDHYLDDLGAKRRVDLRTDDLVRRLRAGG